jgi:hypothetical protein
MISVDPFLFNFFKRGTVNIELIIWPHQQCLTASCINFHTTGQFHYKFGFEKILFSTVRLLNPSTLLCYRFVETDGKAFDRVRRTEIGKKYFKLTHFEEVRLFYISLLCALGEGG